MTRMQWTWLATLALVCARIASIVWLAGDEPRVVSYAIAPAWLVDSAVSLWLVLRAMPAWGSYCVYCGCAIVERLPVPCTDGTTCTHHLCGCAPCDCPRDEGWPL